MSQTLKRNWKMMMMIVMMAIHDLFTLQAVPSSSCNLQSSLISVAMFIMWLPCPTLQEPFPSRSFHPPPPRMFCMFVTKPAAGPLSCSAVQNALENYIHDV